MGLKKSRDTRKNHSLKKQFLDNQVSGKKFGGFHDLTLQFHHSRVLLHLGM